MRRVSVSNIAWPVTHDSSLSSIISGYSSYIDIAPSKYFDYSDNNILALVHDVGSFWTSRGITISAFQSVLFDFPTLNIFNFSHRKDLISIFERTAYIASLLDVHYFVFGCAKNRIPIDGMSPLEVNSVSSDFFALAGDICSKYNILLCLEAAPTIYSGRFLIDHSDLFEYVNKLSHPYVKANLDLGICNILNEDLAVLLSSFSHLVGHVHVSEPNLEPLSLRYQDHALNAQLLKQFLGPEVPFSLEMKSPLEGFNEQILAKSLDFFFSHYH